MNSNAQKTPVARSLNEFAVRKATSAIQLIGKALAASVVKVDATVGSPIVTVKFEIQSPFTLPNVTVPLAGAEYIRLPLLEANGDTPGTKGVVFPADVFLGAMTGLGTGTASLVQPGNLSALVFFPLGNKTWTPPMDKTSVEIYGQKDFGVYIHDNQDTDPPTAFFLLKKNDIDLKIGDFEIEITDGGITITDNNNCLIELDGTDIKINAGNSTNVNINGRNFLTHEHSGVQTGSGNTGPVV